MPESSLSVPTAVDALRPSSARHSRREQGHESRGRTMLVKGNPMHKHFSIVSLAHSNHVRVDSGSKNYEDECVRTCPAPTSTTCLTPRRAGDEDTR